jgi:ABC-type long-subunit fatty acid transport system fused permease/ATPase subunit
MEELAWLSDISRETPGHEAMMIVGLTLVVIAVLWALCGVVALIVKGLRVVERRSPRDN